MGKLSDMVRGYERTEEKEMKLSEKVRANALSAGVTPVKLSEMVRSGNVSAPPAPTQEDAAKYGIIADEEDTLTQRLSANAKERYNPEGWGKFGEYAHKNPGTVAKYAGQEVLGGAADTIEGVGKALKTVTASEDNLTADQKAEQGILEDKEDLQIPANVQKALDERIAAGDAKAAEWKRNLDESRVALREATGAPQIVTDVLNMAGQVALMGATGAAAGGAAVRGLVGASTFGTSYEDATQMGANKGQALLYASLNAIGQGMLEGAGGLGGKGAETALRSILSEGFEEGAGYSLETALQNVLLDAKVPWSAKQAVYNSFLGALGGGAFAAGNVISGRAVTPKMQQQAEEMRNNLEASFAAFGTAGANDYDAEAMQAYWDEVNANPAVDRAGDLTRYYLRQAEQKENGAKDYTTLMLEAAMRGQQNRNAQLANLENKIADLDAILAMQDRYIQSGATADAVDMRNYAQRQEAQMKNVLADFEKEISALEKSFGAENNAPYGEALDKLLQQYYGLFQKYGRSEWAHLERQFGEDIARLEELKRKWKDYSAEARGKHDFGQQSTETAFNYKQGGINADQYMRQFRKDNLSAEKTALEQAYADVVNGQKESSAIIAELQERQRKQRVNEWLNILGIPADADTLQQMAITSTPQTAAETPQGAAEMQQREAAALAEERTVQRKTQGNKTAIMPAAAQTEQQQGFSGYANIPQGTGGTAPSRYATNTLQNAAAAGTVSQEMADALAGSEHEVISWADSSSAAAKWINEQGAEAAHNELIRKAAKGQAINSTELMATQMLIQEYNRMGNSDRAIELGNAVAGAASDIARALNLMRAMLKDLPGGMVRMVEKQVAKSGGTLTDADKVDLNALEVLRGQVATLQTLQGAELQTQLDSLTADMSKPYKQAVENIFDPESGDAANADNWLLMLAQKKADEHAASTPLDKFAAFQRINMLLNTKTQMRNLFGNIFSTAMEMGSDPFASAVDRWLGSKTGKRTVGSGKFSEAVRGAKQGIREVEMARKTGTLGQYGNRYAEGEAQPLRIFSDNSGAASIANTLNDITSYLLTLGDATFSGAREAQVASQLQELNGDTEWAADVATAAGREVTFQNSSWLARKIGGARKGLAGDNAATQFLAYTIMPFVKTPANILSRSISYSPLGLVEGVYAAHKVLADVANATPEMQRKAATAIGRGMFGTLLNLAGLGLAAMGKASGAAPEDKDEAAFMKDVGGVLPNSIKIGNTWVDISNLGPGPVALNIGASVYNELSKAGFEGNVAAQITEALLDGVVSDVTGDSLWQGIMDTVAYFEEGDVWGFFTNAIADAGGQMVPFNSFLRTITNSVDKYKRETSAKGDIGWSVNYILSNVPGVSQNMPIKYDVTGEAVERYEGGKASDIFNAWLNPAAGMSKDKTDSELYRNIMDLYEKEGSKSIFPTVAPYSVDYKGDKHALRGKERSEYQKTSGKEITQQLDDLFASNAYKQATSEQQVDMIADLIGYSTAEAKTVFLKGKDITYEKSGTSKTIEKLAASGVPASATVLLAATDRSNDKDVENSGAVKAAKTIVALNLDAGAEQVMLEHFGSKAVATAVKNARNTNTDATAYLDTWLALTNAETGEAAKKALRGTSVSDKALLTMLSDSASGKYSRFDSRWSANGRSYSALSPKTYVLCVATLDGSLNKAGNVKRLMDLGLSKAAAGDFITLYNSQSSKYD